MKIFERHKCPPEYLRILLIVDCDEVAESCLAELEQAGIPVRVHMVQSPADLETSLIGQQEFDVVVSDFCLQGWNGMEAWKAIQAHQLDIPFILLMGTIGEEHAIESIKAGIADCVLKSSMSRLPLAIRRAMRERSLQRERERALQDLRLAHDQLEARVEMRTAELRKANKDLVAEMGERQLAQTKANQLATIVEAMQNFVATARLDGTVVYLNYAARHFLGKEQGDFTSLSLERLLPGWRKLLAETHDQSESISAWRGETILYGVEKPPVPVLALLTIHHDGAGESYVSLVAHDITDRKQVERLKDELVSTVSHELRTPLASMRGFTELMLKREFDRPKMLEYIRIVHDESIRLGELINELLDLQKMEAGMLQYQMQEIRLDEILRNTVAVFNTPASTHRFILQIDELPRVMGDAKRLSEVFRNLISNAVKYSPGGGNVEIKAQCNEGDVVVSIRDEGIGIPDEAMEHLFEKFFRAENGANRSIGGTGLGLALVKQIIQAHGGRVWAESVPQTGSCFYVALPNIPAVRSAEGVDAGNDLRSAPSAKESGAGLTVEPFMQNASNATTSTSN